MILILNVLRYCNGYIIGFLIGTLAFIVTALDIEAGDV